MGEHLSAMRNPGSALCSSDQIKTKIQDIVRSFGSSGIPVGKVINFLANIEIGSIFEPIWQSTQNMN